MTNEELAALIQQGKKEYIPLLYAQVEKFLKSKARFYYFRQPAACSRRGVEFDDLISESYFAMLDAINYYKSENEYKFLTYIEYPLKNRYNKLMGLRNSRDKFEPLDIAESIDKPLSVEDDALTLRDTLVDGNPEMQFDEVIQKGCHQSLHDMLEKGMEALTPRQRSVIESKYYKNMTLNEIGQKIGCSSQAVRSLEIAALRAFRYCRISNILRDFL